MEAEAQSCLCGGLEHREGQAMLLGGKPIAPSKASAPLGYPVSVGVSVLSAPALVLFDFTPGGRGTDIQGRLGMMIPVGRMDENTPENIHELSFL